MQLAHQAAAIRAEVSRIEGRRGRGKAYPRSLQITAASYFRAKRAQGASQRDIGEELGIHEDTLRRWASALSDAPPLESTPPSDFAPVEILDAAPPRPRGAILVRGPGGLLIEGLDIDSLAELVRRLS